MPGVGNVADGTIPAPTAPPVPEAANDPPGLWGARLGSIRGAWTILLGPPKSGVVQEFSNGTGVVRRIEGAQERAAMVQVGHGKPLPDADARRAAAAYRPADSKPVRSYEYKSGAARVQVFHSDALARVFGAGTGGSLAPGLGSEPPGTFCEWLTGGSKTTATFTTLQLGILQ
jgi:hypothetical protein